MGTRPGTGERRPSVVGREARRSGPPYIERRLHDALDLASGKIGTTEVLVDALTAEARVKRLADLGFGADPSVLVQPEIPPYAANALPVRPRRLGWTHSMARTARGPA